MNQTHVMYSKTRAASESSLGLDRTVYGTESMRQRDERAYGNRREALSSAEYLRHAAQESGRSPASLTLEFLKLLRGRGKLTLPEYVQYGVYRPTLTGDERGRFIANALHWPITRRCCDFSWQATTEDKWLCTRILERSGIRVLSTLAVIDTSARTYPGTRTIRTPAELCDFVLASTREGDTVFAKENRGIASFGAFLVLEGDRDRLHVHGEGWVEYETFMRTFVGETCYVLQSRLRNHAFLDRWTEHLATVRICLLLKPGGGVSVPFAILKLPSQDNIADQFWRPGNVACDVDPNTGTILKARTKDRFGTVDHEVHPTTGVPLVGETLPMWDRVIDFAQTCAPVFTPVRYQSMDIAISGDGPVLVEINTGGGFDLPQLASGRGFLTDPVCEFFRDCGYNRV